MPRNEKNFSSYDMVSHPLLQMSTSHIVVKRRICVGIIIILLQRNMEVYFLMQKIKQTFQSSLSELKNIKVLCVLGMLGALSIVLYTITFQITDAIQIGLDPVCNILADCLFGPAVGSIFSGAMDMLNFFLNPRGAFNPGLTLNAIISGLFIGSMFYKKKPTPVKLFLVLLADHIILNAFLGTYWLYLVNGSGMLAWFPTRLASNLAKPFVETAIILIIYKALETSGLLQTLKKPFKQK